MGVERSHGNAEIRHRSLRGSAAQNAPYLRQASSHVRDALQKAGLAHQNSPTGIVDLMPQELATQGRVDGYGNGTELVDRKPRNDRVDVVVKHGDDSLARLDAKISECVSKAGCESVKGTIAALFSAEVEEGSLGRDVQHPLHRVLKSVLLVAVPFVQR
jgi:hypothetical protein